MKSKNALERATPDPHTGSRPISEAVQNAVQLRILNHAREHYAGKYRKIEVRFNGALCYVDAYQEPSPGSDGVAALTGETPAEFAERMRNTPVRLVRLRHFDENRWSIAFYTYSNERYEPCSTRTANRSGWSSRRSTSGPRSI